MALYSPECDDTEFLIFDCSQHAAHVCDIDLTCYESFYDSFPQVESGANKGDIEDSHKRDDLGRLRMFERTEMDIGCCSTVPDVDFTWLGGDSGMQDVLTLYNIVKRELFSDFLPDDSTACLFAAGDSPALETSLLGLQQVPILINDVNATDSVSPGSSPRTPEKTGSHTELEAEGYLPTSQSPVRSTESDSHDDARVPSSCTNDFHPSGSYYIEE